MSDLDKQQKMAREWREDEDKPNFIPAIYRYQPFTNLDDRMTTKSLNRVIMVGIGAALALDIFKPVWNGFYEAAYCYECRACYATQEKCPASITYQAELTIACRTLDYRRFIDNKGLLCFRCGNCNGVCVQYLDLAYMFGKMGIKAIEDMKKGKIPFSIIEEALQNGNIGRPYIVDVYDWYRSKGGKRLDAKTA